MATLKQLIDNGLQFGQLVRNESFILQHEGNDWFKLVKEFGLYSFIARIKSTHEFVSDDNYELTTAYDSNIDPDTLPVPEPFATGWVVCTERWYNDLLNFVIPKDTKIPIIDNRIEYHGIRFGLQTAFASICRPCLPPL